MSIYHKLGKILPVIASPIIIEIGAHIGTDTKKIARLLQRPYLYIAIEPDKRNHPKLKELCERLDITLVPFAIGDKTGEVNFWYSEGRSLATDFNSLKRPIKTSGRPDWVEFKRGRVQCLRLDDLVFNELFFENDSQNIDLIWMDVQGAELEVIRGATKTLERTRYLYTECQEGRYEGQPGFARIMMALSGVWEIVYKDPANVLLRNAGL